jgi:hypothetical protein
MAQKTSQPIESFDSSLALVDDSQLAGGYHVVDDEAARDAIPVGKRKIGIMVAWLVAGVATFKQYTGADLTDPEWTNDANWVGGGGGGGGGFTDNTYAELVTAFSAGTLNAGSFYRVTDRGDVCLIFQAVSTNQLAVNGTRVMLCPATYATVLDPSGNNWLGIWHSALTPVANDLVIWGGQVWNNVAGNVGAALDDVTLDAEWTLVPKASFANDEYIQMVFGCQYDWINDYVVKQWDSHDNIFIYDPDYDSQNNCDISDWNWGTYNFLYSNHCRGIYNNAGAVPNAFGIYTNNSYGAIKNNVKSGGDISNNTVGDISYNHMPGNISNNACIGDISNNTCLGNVSYNTNIGSINFNSNTEDIEFNSNAGDVEQNSNLGVISNNSNLGGISHNTNEGAISYNSNHGEITTNSNIGSIAGNANTGDIDTCSSGANPCNITSNINNGSISGVYAADVSDPIVNK